MILSNILYVSSASTQIRQGELDDIRSDPPEILNIFNSLEYTFVIDGADIFPSESIKHDITMEYKSSKYNISKLEYSILDHNIAAWEVIVQADPSSIDDTKTKVGVKIYAKRVHITGNLVNKNYENMNLQSIYGIYDKVSDKMNVHMPIYTAISLLI